MNNIQQIIRANILGYCMGVRRAIQSTENAIKDFPDIPIYTFGPLIHNNSTLHNLEKAGVSIIEESHLHECLQGNGLSLKGSIVIIRAHGIPPQTHQLMQQLQMNIIDATCPRVLSSHRRAVEFSKKGYTVIIAGDKNHAEVTGIKGYAEESGNECIIIENSIEASQVKTYPEKAVLISQTTIKQSEYDSIIDILKNKIQELKVCDTICPATIERQHALEKLSPLVDGILVIGSRSSANTQRLLKTALEINPCATLIESPEEIPELFYSLEKIGITAGASTPDSIIDAVEKALKKQ